MPLVKWFLYTFHLGLNISRSQIKHELAFHLNTPFLSDTRKDDKPHDNSSDTDNQGICETSKIVDDIKNKGQGYHKPYQNGKQQGRSVVIALYPKDRKSTRLNSSHAKYLVCR